jgi:hypothetical protein
MICSLGERCHNGMALYNIGYRKEKLPFDYIISKLDGITNIISQKSFEECINISVNNITNNELYFNFPHHNIKNNESNEDYKLRLLLNLDNKLDTISSYIKNNKRILFIYTNRYKYNNLESAIEKFMNKLNYSNYKLLLILPNKINAKNINAKNIHQIIYNFDFSTNINMFQGTDYGDYKMKQFIGNYIQSNYYLDVKKLSTNNNDTITCIYTLGSRCLNSSILKKYNMNKFNSIFDSINIKKLGNLYSVLCSNFNNLINKNYLKPVVICNETKTMNILFDTNNDLTFPHHNLFDNLIYDTFIKRITRFNKLKYFNTLFVFTITDNKDTMDNMIYYGNLINNFLLCNNYKFKFLIIDLITINDNINDKYKLVYSNNNLFIYNLFINNNSYTGGEFKNNIDNDNFISLINTFINKSIYINIDEIDKLEL